MTVEIEIRSAEWSERARALKEEGWILSDLCGLDRMHLGHDARYGIVVQLLHRDGKERQSLHVAAEGDPPAVPSVCELWPGANFFEREAYDMFGIRFEGHPNLTRILMPDEWEGHPLRKDYSVGKVPVDFVRQPLIQVNAPGQSSTPGAAGARTDRLGQALPDDPAGDGGTS